MELERSTVVEYIAAKDLKSHPLNVKIYGEDGYQDLIESIRALGILQPLYINRKNIIISGHRRWKAARIIDENSTVPCLRVVYASELDEHEAIIEYNRQRIKDGQQLHNEGVEIEHVEAERARERQGSRNDLSNIKEQFPECERGQVRDLVAEKIGLGSGKQWDKLKYVAENNPGLLPQIKPDGISLGKAYQDTKTLTALNSEQQTKVLELVSTGQAKNIITARKLLMREEVANIKPPEGKYQVLYADPPWEYDFGFDIHGAAARHYNTMTIDELCKLPIVEIADENAVLFLWVTSPKLRDCFAMIEAWGFEYKTSFVWDKVKHVMGHYNSVRHEFLLLCIRGSYPKQSNTLADSVITVERNSNHSEKPEEFRDLIDTMYPLAKKVELFTDKSVPGWNSWGAHGENPRAD